MPGPRREFSGNGARESVRHRVLAVLGLRPSLPCPSPRQPRRDSRSTAAQDLDHRSVRLNDRDSRQEIQHCLAELALDFQLCGTTVEQADNDSEEQEAHDNPENSKVDVEFHHVPDSKRGLLGKEQTGHLAHDVSTAGFDRLVRPERTRNDRQGTFPQRAAMEEFGFAALDSSSSKADEVVLIQPRIQSPQVSSVAGIEPLDILDCAQGSRHTSLGISASPDGPANRVAVLEIPEENADADENEPERAEHDPGSASRGHCERRQDDHRDDTSVTEKSAEKEHERGIEREDEKPAPGRWHVASQHRRAKAEHHREHPYRSALLENRTESRNAGQIADGRDQYPAVKAEIPELCARCRSAHWWRRAKVSQPHTEQETRRSNRGAKDSDLGIDAAFEEVASIYDVRDSARDVNQEERSQVCDRESQRDPLVSQKCNESYKAEQTDDN